MLEGKNNLKIDVTVLSEFGKSLMDHPVVDGNIKFESNVNHFNLLKACQYFFDETTTEESLFP